MLRIHRAERADALVSGLARMLTTSTGDVFGPEVVAVPSRGVERWLAQQLSRTLGAESGDDGVCANVLFPSVTSALDEALTEASEAYAEAVEVWAPERLRWPLLDVIDRDARQPWLSVLARHLGLDADGEAADRGRRVSVAGKLATLFERYGRSRPELVRSWRAGGADVSEDLRWQPELWRRVRAEVGVPAPAELIDQACAAVGGGPSFSIFGVTRIDPARVLALAAIAAERDVHLWLHHPSPALWQAVQGERPGRRRERAPVAKHPLLASMTRDVHELQQLLGGIEHDDEHLPIPARPLTMLGRLQHELATDTVPTTPGTIDRSVQVHAAHGAARQVEVLREVVLGLLADDPSLEPRDVVIMCPDVETFAPLIAAGFGMAETVGGHPAAGLRVKLADRSLRRTNAMLDLLSAVLELADGRVGATALLDLAGALPVRRRFGFDADDLERLRGWTLAAGARWGLDAGHRVSYGLGGVAQNTWRSALDRLLLGVAMEEHDTWVGDVLPFDDVDSTDIDLVGRFAEFVDRVSAAVGELGLRHTAVEWIAVLERVADDLGEPQQPWERAQLQRLLSELAEQAADTRTPFGLADVTALLADRLAGRPTRANFRTGTLTVCTLVPMRSVPHRVVCLLGLDDAAFPRRGIADGDDVLARDPHSGERDVRSEDRQLFLDAICAAQEHLVITYTGADPRTGSEVPPCVPLGELLDALDASAAGPDARPAREHVVVRHPLQPFDRRNFTDGELGCAGPFSFDRAALSAARAGSGSRVEPQPMLATALPPAAADDVGLDELVRFFQHPVRGFLRQRLGITTFDANDDPSDSMSIALEGLEGWAVGERILSRCLSGTSRETAAQLEFRRGVLPPLRLGAAELTTIGGRIDALLAACERERMVPARSVEVQLTLADGRSLTGTVSGLRGSTVLEVGYSSLAPKQRLAAWIRYLALVATSDPARSDHSAVVVGRYRDGARRATFRGVTPELARQCLELLVHLRDDGLRVPLPMALATSAEYARRRQSGATVGDSLPAAARIWEAGRFEPERDQPEHVLIWGSDLSFDRLCAAPASDRGFDDEPTRFGELARAVWGPLLTVERDG